MTSPPTPEAHPLSPEDRRRGMTALCLAVGAVGVASSVQIGLNVNFLTEIIGVDGFQMGLLESLREVCGILALVVLALLAGVGEPLVGALMLIVFGLGLGGYAFAPNYWWVVGMSFVWSQGIHVWMPLPHSMTLALAEPGRSGHRLGQVAAAGTAAFGAGLVASFLLSKLGMGMRPIYLIAMAFAMLGALACLRIPRASGTKRPRLVFRRRYAHYYLISFFEGWRKQIFLCFAGFLLVERHQVSLPTMLLLQIGVQAVRTLFAAPVGRLVDRVGERPILIFNYTGLVVFCAGYSFLSDVRFLAALYMLDSIFFIFGVALNTYVGKLAPPAERTGTLSMGVAMNHLASVVMPLLGGVLWVTLGYQWTFLVGALAGALSVGVALALPRLPATLPQPE